MEEATYLNEGQIVVTSSRIDVRGQTFAVRNIGSVKVEDAGRPWGGILLALLAIGAIGAEPVLGVPLLALAGYMMFRKMATKRLVLVSGGGEVVALESRDGRFVERARAAIAQAISVR